MKRILSVLMTMTMLGGGTLAAAEGRSITAETQVTKWGQMPVRFTVRGQQLPEGIGPEGFTIAGEAAGWGTQTTHPFACGVKEVIPEADGWSLVPEQFPDKYFYVRSFTVACEAAPELGFTMADIGETTAGAADLFTLREAENGRIKAWVYRPETEVPLPVVVVFHGYGDTANLLTYRTAVDWAEPEHQAARPCIVIAPTIEDGLYVSDNSFGGMSSIEMAEQYPDRVAAVMALCPALNYSRTGMGALAKMKDIPLFIAQAERDETIPVSVGRQAAEELEKAGGNVTLKVFTDAEMEAAGAVHGQEQTYSFHHAELALLENEDYAEWLFSWRKR